MQHSAEDAVPLCQSMLSLLGEVKYTGMKQGNIYKPATLQTFHPPSPLLLAIEMKNKKAYFETSA